ncbi:uncharacterized protein LOC125232799 [Leguminivora glycinivorella]|uniref:uncharacterized protein LOC125232799 n=1 Tax=Leguminivora glycinivorella TaxID=1035111 RepID=UPI002010348A|nr:uncharacterized protein LOC125232799 [Leguminivora glycinivorella]
MESILIIPERTEVEYANEKYLYNLSTRVVRYGRRSAYYYNLVAGLRHTFGNNITINLLFYEGQNNQYKRSLVEIKLKLCDLFQRDQYFGKMFSQILRKHGKSCPFPPGLYEFLNTTLPSEKFPNILLFEKGKIELVFNQLPTQDLVAKISTIFTIKRS